MAHLRYLNTVLTLIAVLLTVQLWTQWSGSPLSETTVGVAHAQGIPDAGQQRKVIIDELGALNRNVSALVKLFVSGGAHVQVDNLPAPREDAQSAAGDAGSMPPGSASGSASAWAPKR